MKSCWCDGDQTTGGHFHHQGGLAERIEYGRPGNLVSGLSWVMPVCEECGAVLADQRRHDEWHDS